MHAVVSEAGRVNKAGVEDRSVLLRTSFREGGKVKHETLANLSAVPDSAVETLRASLAGKTMGEVEAEAEAETTLAIMRSLPHCHIESVYAMARGLGFEAMLDPACRERDIVMALLANVGPRASSMQKAAGCSIKQHPDWPGEKSWPLPLHTPRINDGEGSGPSCQRSRRPGTCCGCCITARRW